MQIMINFFQILIYCSLRNRITCLCKNSKSFGQTKTELWAKEVGGFYVAIEKYNLLNFPQSSNSVVPYKQYEQDRQDPHRVCVSERTTAFAQFPI